MRGLWARIRGLAAVAIGVVAVAAALPAISQPAEGLSALARFLPEGSGLRDSGDGFVLDLAITQPVPWRVRLLNAPPRMVLDFAEVDFAGLRASDSGAALGRARAVIAVRAGNLRPGWSRLVLELAGPQGVDSAEMRADPASGRAMVRVRMSPVSADSFAAAAEPAEAALGLDVAGLPVVRPQAPRPGERPLVVVLDPGHGGIDPGAERDGLRESDLMLSIARELREALLRTGDFRVVLTREEDVFVSLEARIRTARAAGADVFLSLHADALPDGGASGATVYTLSDEASDAAAAALAERHDRADLLAGVDLTDQDDLIAEVLISIARTETMPRTDALAETLVAAIGENVGRMHRRPLQAAGFSVLKAPDIPSVLVELGFMSSPRDLADLQDPAWRALMAESIVAALQRWALEDAATAGLRRR